MKLLADRPVFINDCQRTDIYFDAPLDYSNEKGPKITIHACEYCSKSSSTTSDLPTLLFLQGGPGFAGPLFDEISGWIQRALQDYKVIILDQRGTGKSSLVSLQTLEGLNVDEQFSILKNMRAYSIIQDCEILRRKLNRNWTLLGQSYGGFLACCYLNLYPKNIEKVFLTCGIPPYDFLMEDIYKKTTQSMINRADKYYELYPNDKQIIHDIIKYIDKHENTIELPYGGILTVERFLQLGLCLGSQNGFSRLHNMLSQAFVIPYEKILKNYNKGNEESLVLSNSFLMKIGELQVFGENPLYFLLHESIYCDHPKQSPYWRAQHVIEKHFSVEFDYKKRIQNNEKIYFFGEHVFNWMADKYQNLKPFKSVMERFVENEDWEILYPIFDAIKRQNNGEFINEKELESIQDLHNVKIACFIATEDVYVDYDCSKDVISKYLPQAKVIESNEHTHSALREDGVKVLDSLFSLLK